MAPVRLLIGGSPCTHWSIAQTKARETEPKGMGWELFRNYLIALDKYKPDYFLYENNKSMSSNIKAQITKEFGVEPTLINSAQVSAQNRQRFYWVGKHDPIMGHYNTVPVAQPADRGLIVQDILETGIAWREKAYTLDSNYYKTLGRNVGFDTQAGRRKMVAEPIRVCNINGGEQGNRIYSAEGKSCAIKTQGGGLGGHGQGLYAVPFMRVPEATKQGYVDIYPGECVDLAQANSKTRRGRRMAEKSNCLTTTCALYEYCGTLDKPIYQVKNGLISINGQQFPIKLRDGCYIIRKLTVTECKRLQTVPETYIFPVSNTQAYKMLGNGWTVDVISHIMDHFDGVTTRPVEVLSMYDGMSCGHIALDKLGANVSRYYATEIDKYAIQTTQHNYPETIQLGDAFQVRDPGWKL